MIKFLIQTYEKVEKKDTGAHLGEEGYRIHFKTDIFYVFHKNKILLTSILDMSPDFLTEIEFDVSLER